MKKFISMFIMVAVLCMAVFAFADTAPVVVNPNNIDLTGILAHFISPTAQAYVFYALFAIYVIGNAVFPFIGSTQINGWEHMLYLAFKNLKADPTTKTVTFDTTELKAEIKSYIDSKMNNISGS